MFARLLFVFALFGAIAATRDQSIGVHGKLVCGSKPAANVRVKLWEEDSGPDPDDLLDQGYTDGNGEFKLQGGTAELTPIDPVFKVYHDCDDLLPGSRKVKFGLPKSYITNGKIAQKSFDIGVLNLETVFAKEERELIVSRMRRGGVNEEMDDTKLYEEEQREKKRKEEEEEKNKKRKGSSSSSDSSDSNEKEKAKESVDKDIAPAERLFFL